MKYRKFGETDIDISLLGFGAMRMPIIDGDMAKIDEPEAIRMIRYAIDNGVNYVDNGYFYHRDHGETLVGKALEDGYREKVFLATKLPLLAINKPEDMMPIFERQLSKLRTDYIDFYLLHDINDSSWDKVKSMNMWDFLIKLRDAGKIGHIGFSYHGSSPELFKEIIDEYPWEYCQLQINFMDKNLQAGVEGFEYAVSKNVPVIVMEPLMGGKLTDIIHPKIQKYWDSIGTDRTPAEWAFRWVANLPGVMTILSGMTAMEQLEENLRVLSLSDVDTGMLTDAELGIFEEVAEEYRNLILYKCTACNYCMPCPAGLNIPGLIGYRNTAEQYGIVDKLKRWEYTFRIKVNASECTACGTCEPKCPQHLEIMNIMKETAEIFG